MAFHLSFPYFMSLLHGSSFEICREKKEKKKYIYIYIRSRYLDDLILLSRVVQF